MRALLNRFFLFPAAVIFTLAFIPATACKNPVSLGATVDTAAPVIEIITEHGTGPGAFLNGTQTIYIDATDDSGVKSVTAFYTYSVYDQDGKLVEQPPVTVPVQWNESALCYTFDIDTTIMADGPLKVQVEAVDKSGKKTLTPELIYTVKNNPPLINMQIPKARPSVDKVETYKQYSLVNDAPYPLVVTDNYIMGVFEDLAGVAGGYPQIKLWKASATEPGTEGTDYRANAGWATAALTQENSPGDGWVYVDEGLSDSRYTSGEKGGSFRYYMRERKPDGTPEDEGTGKGLETGIYYLKLRAQDISNIPVEWPKDAYSNDPGYLIVELTADTTPPVVEIINPPPEKIYQRNDFYIEAAAYCQGEADTDIAEMTFAVTGKNASGERKQVTLKRWTGGDTGEGIPSSFMILLGKTYYSQGEGDEALIADDEQDVPPDAFSWITFNDGNFNFTVTARGDTGSRKDAPLSIYVDRQPPSASVTGIEPYFSQDSIADTQEEDGPNNSIHDYTDPLTNQSAPDPYRRWTVNSTVKISVNSTDSRGSAVDEESGYMKFKYFFLKNEDIAESVFDAWKSQSGNGGRTFGEYLYERADALFFEQTKENPVPVPPGVPDPNSNPLVKVEGSDGAFTLVLQTRQWDAAAASGPYRLWLYITAMDNAENISYSKILLYVDQETDKPVIQSNIAADGSTFMGENFYIQLAVSDDNGLLPDSVSFRYAQNDEEKNRLDMTGDGWTDLPAAPSVDGLSISIQNLTLKQIACGLLGHAYDPAHTMDAAHKDVLGPEAETKWFQVRARDNAGTKVYPATDGSAVRESGWADFTIDLTYPEIAVPETDIEGNYIDRDEDNPFIAPEKNGAYQKLDFAYGSLIERNLKTVTVKIDGDPDATAVFEVPRSLETLLTGEPEGTDFAVWKTVAEGWDGELRWRVPMAELFNSLKDDSHTFEISFEDRIPQVTTKSLTFYKDSNGPEISLITLGRKVYLSDEDIGAIDSGSTGAVAGLAEKISEIGDFNTINDASGRIIGGFTDSFSPVFSAGNNGYWYKLDGGEWTWITVLPVDITGSKSGAWQIPLPETMTDGYHRLSIRVKDSRGNGYDSASETPEGQNGGPGFEAGLAFLLDRSIPLLSIESPDPWPDFLNRDTAVTGKITNTFSVQKLSARLDGNEIALYEPAAGTSYGGITVEPSPGIDKSFDYIIPVAAASLSESSHALIITATGASGQSSMEVRNFTFDKTAPSVSFNSPSAGALKETGNLSDNGRYEIYWSETWVTGQAKIGGVSDDKNGVSKIYYHLGKLGDDSLASDSAREAVYAAASWTDTLLDEDSPIAGWEGGLYYWSYTENLNPYQYNDGMIEKNVDPSQAHTANMFYLPLYVKIVDRGGNVHIAQYKIYVDPDMDIPQASITTPDNGAKVGGEIRVTGTANDNNWVHSVEIRVTDTAKSPGSSGYYYKAETDDWAYGENPANPANTGWVKAKIQGPTDVVVAWYYSINSDGSLNPEPGGTRDVRIEVRALDTKDSAHQIPDLTGSIVSRSVTFLSEVPIIAPPVISKAGVSDRPYSEGIRVSGNFTISTSVQDVGGLSSIRARQSGLSAFVEIVKDGLAVSGNLQTGWEITAPPQENMVLWEPGWRYYILDPGSISNWPDIDNAYFEGKHYGPGVMIQYKYGSSITGSGATAFRATGDRAADNNDYTNWNSQHFKYDLSFNIDSTTLPNLDYGKTGIYTLEIQAYNNNQVPNPYNTNGTYNLAVDNYYPATAITTQYSAATSQFYVSGTATDYDTQSGAVQGLERLLVYFERDGEFYNARGKKPGQTDTFYSTGGNFTGGLNPFNRQTEWGTIPAMTSMPLVKDVNETGTPYTGYAPNVPVFDNFPVLQLISKGGNTGDVWESPHAMVIDRQEMGTLIDSDGDGTFAEMWEGQADKLWQARLDTTVFGDGPLTVHYIAMDLAGNATHYKEEIYIGNKKPLIRRVSLRTDIRNEGTGWAGNPSPGDYTDPIVIGSTEDGNLEHTTGFRIRNNGFGLRLESLYGNGQKSYVVTYVTRNPARVKSTDMVRGTVYTISETEPEIEESGGGNTDWTKYGAPYNNEGTTFVASGPAREKTDDGDDTTGWAWAYTYPGSAGTEERGNFPSGNSEVETSPDITDDIVFSNFANMPDTAAGLSSAGLKEYDAGGSMILLHDKRFIIKVYDNTVPGGTEAEQLAHVALINVDFDNNDTQPPFISIRPFYWNGISDNSVYDSDGSTGGKPAAVFSDLLGHIELESDLAGGTGFSSAGTGVDDFDPKVSGRVSFRGTAFDNNTIGNVYFRITNNVQDTLNFSDPGATGVTIGSAPVYYQAASFTSGSLVPVADRFGSGWKFEIEKETHDENGHSIEWALHFDSGFINGVALADNVITVVARDIKPGTANQSAIPGSFAQTTEAVKTAQYRFDVVPYISEVGTKLTRAYSAKPSAFNRSALGWYPVGENEVITVRGFNLRDSDTDTLSNPAAGNPAVRINTSSSGITFTGANANDPPAIAGQYVSKSLVRVNIGTAVTSGELELEVNGFASLNNRTGKAVEYNQEPNDLNNNILDNSRNLYIWQIGNLLSDTTMQTSSFMRMGNNSSWYLTYSTYDGTGRLRVMKDGSNQGTSTNGGQIENYNNRYLNNTIAVDQAGDWYVGASNMTATTPVPNFNFYARRDATNTNGTAGNYKRMLENTNADANRILIPRIFAQNTNGTTTGTNTYPTRIIMSYFDSIRNELVLRYGYVGTTNTSGMFGHDLPNNNGSATNGTFGNRQVVANGSTYGTSVYSAAGALSDGRPLIAWYDNTEQRLLFAYGNDTPGATGGSITNYYTDSSAYVTGDITSWTANTRIVPDSQGRGSHVDMAVDSDNNVHLAYYDAMAGGLYYTYIPSSAVVSTNTDGILTVPVDTYLSAGTKIMLNVRRENHGTTGSPIWRQVPYISYFHMSFAETNNSVRITWRKDFSDTATLDENGIPRTGIIPHGTRSDDSFTGAWQVMTVPASTIAISSEFICSGVPTTGTLATTNTTGISYTNIQKSFLVGYKAGTTYHGAILKKDLW